MRLTSKINRYKNLFAKIRNWRPYLWNKFFGFDDHFDFDVKGFGLVSVPKVMLGPFRENFLDEVYFTKVSEIIAKRTNTPVIIDIGANIGYFSLSVFAKFPDAMIFAFEPHPYCFEVMSQYREKFSRYNFNIFNCAVSDTDDLIRLFIPEEEALTTIASVFRIKSKETKEIRVQAIRLESFISKQGLDKIDLLKLDCEGSEYAILYSLPKELFSKISALSIETHKCSGLNENLDALKDFIANQGYHLKHLRNGITGYIWAWRSDNN